MQKWTDKTRRKKPLGVSGGYALACVTSLLEVTGRSLRIFSVCKAASMLHTDLGLVCWVFPGEKNLMEEYPPQRSEIKYLSFPPL